MPIQIIRQDITKLKTDAIVNPSNEDLVPGGGVDEAIHAAAGSRLADACAELSGCELGQAKITPAFDLPCKYVIHTVGPIWHGGYAGERALLESCYTKALMLAKKHKCKSVAFPLISSGAYGYPKDRVLRVAMDCISEFLYDNEMTVYIVVYDRDSHRLSEELYHDVISYIDDHYSEDDFAVPPMHFAMSAPISPKQEREMVLRNRRRKWKEPEEDLSEYDSMAPCASCESFAPSEQVGHSVCEEKSQSLEDALRAMDKGFAETLFDYIDAKGMDDVDCYKRANIDRKTFSRIKCSKTYKPSKVTVLSFAIALRLNLEETDHLLNTVGMSLSRSSKFDVIVEYFIRNEKYDINEINETLFAFDQLLLGV